MKTLRVVIVGVTLALACRPSDVRESRDFERMRRQQRYDLYDASRFFPNGATMQAAPLHSVARAPVVALEPASESLGHRQFAISCAPCHGAGGFGGGPIAPNLGERRPPSLRSAKVAALPDSQLIAVMTDGLGMMPPLGWQLTPAARTSIATYIRSLANRPLAGAERSDSAMADYLHRVDSLTAAGAPVAQILKLRRGSR
jgi:mono/diheme cytochrome c family protein